MSMTGDRTMERLLEWQSYADVEIAIDVVVGSIVRVKKSVVRPEFGWGAITHDCVGEVVKVLEKRVYVDFNEDHNRWVAIAEELEVIA